MWLNRQEGLPYRSLKEAITLASIIQKEGLENKLIAGVLINRLKNSDAVIPVIKSNDAVKRINEKPVYKYNVNAGIYLITYQIVDLIPSLNIQSTKNQII